MTLRDYAIRYGFIVLLFGLVAYFAIAADGFVSPQSAVFIFQSVAITGVLALGVTATLVVGGFDLSIGSVATIAMMAAAYVMVVLEQNAVVAVIVCLLIGAIVGLINGWLIVYMRVPDLLATLGMMFLLRRPAAHSDRGPLDRHRHDHARRLGRQRQVLRCLPGARPPPLRLLHPEPHPGVGGGAGRARRADLVLPRIHPLRPHDVRRRLAMSGPPNSPVRLSRHTRSGPTSFQAFLPRSAAYLLAARLGRGDIASGNNLLLDAVAAALIGYAVLGAAKPNAFGTAVGALFVGILLQGLTMMNAPYYTQDFVKGVVLVVALVFTFAFSGRGRG